MRREAVFRMLPLTWVDVVVYGIISVLFTWQCSLIAFGNEALSKNAADTIFACYIAAQFLTLHFLYRWIRNAYNLIALFLFGLGQYAFFSYTENYAIQGANPLGATRGWSVFLIILVLFRILKLNLYQSELAIPLRILEAPCDQRVTWVDVACLIFYYIAIVLSAVFFRQS